MKRFFKIHWSFELTVTVVVFIIVLLCTIIFDYIFNVSSREFIIAFNGLTITLLFTLVILFFNKRNEFKESIKKYHEEIDDYRDLRTEEGKYRVLGLVKRLQKLGNLKFDLNRCCLKNIILEEFTFEQSDFNCINLTSAYIRKCVFINVNFRGAIFTNANIVDCQFINCDLEHCNFCGVILYNIDFPGSNIKDFNERNNLHLARVIYNPSNLPESLLQEIKSKKPELLEKPTAEKFNRLFS